MRTNPESRVEPGVEPSPEPGLEPDIQPGDQQAQPGGQEFQFAARWAREAAIHAAGRNAVGREPEENAGHTVIRNIQRAYATTKSLPDQSQPNIDQIVQRAMASVPVSQNLRDENHSQAIVTAHLIASALRTEVDEWHSGDGPKPWMWESDPSGLREQYDRRDPTKRVTHSHSVISALASQEEGRGAEQKVERFDCPAWLCEKCNDRTVCQHCPCIHWPFEQ